MAATHSQQAVAPSSSYAHKRPDNKRKCVEFPWRPLAVKHQRPLGCGKACPYNLPAMTALLRIGNYCPSHPLKAQRCLGVIHTSHVNGATFYAADPLPVPPSPIQHLRPIMHFLVSDFRCQAGRSLTYLVSQRGASAEDRRSNLLQPQQT